jgi:hypothetical protein
VRRVVLRAVVLRLEVFFVAFFRVVRRAVDFAVAPRRFEALFRVEVRRVRLDLLLRYVLIEWNPPSGKIWNRRRAGGVDGPESIVPRLAEGAPRAGSVMSNSLVCDSRRGARRPMRARKVTHRAAPAHRPIRC